MSKDMPETVTPGACCDICKQPLKSPFDPDAACAQAIEDENGNALIDAPFIWFHKSCLKKG